jgi:hypothetical protein
MLWLPGGCQEIDDPPGPGMRNAEVGTVQSGRLDLANPDELHGVNMSTTMVK